MNYSISNNAEFGEYITARDHQRAVQGVMKQVLQRHPDGEYAKQFILENRAGARRCRRSAASWGEHQIEGRREAARDDALDQGQQAGGQGAQLSFDPSRCT
jgi:ketol-acid reductoisomerase